MEHYEKAVKSIKDVETGHFAGPKPESLIKKAEAALGLRFPPSYRRFLKEMGCGGVRGFEIYGIVDENFEDSSVPNGIWFTLDERRTTSLDPAWVIVGDSGDGSLYAIDTSKHDAHGENPVILISEVGSFIENIAASFEVYFLERLENCLED